MSARRRLLAEERQRLLAQSGHLREQVAVQAAVLVPVLEWGDRLRNGARWVQRHPMLVVTALVAVAVVRPRVAWRWSLRAWSVWQLMGRWRRRVVGASRK